MCIWELSSATGTHILGARETSFEEARNRSQGAVIPDHTLRRQEDSSMRTISRTGMEYGSGSRVTESLGLVTLLQGVIWSSAAVLVYPIIKRYLQI